jgi:hypothetical protein
MATLARQEPLRPACRPRSSGRRRRRRLTIDERRSGFDRRRNVCRSTVAAALEAPVLRLRDDPRLLAEVLVLINVMSALDLFITLSVLRLGAVELNPLMAYLLELGPLPAAFVKLGLVVSATAGLWVLRRHRAALTTAFGLAVAYGTLISFEVAGLLRLVL